MQEEYCDTLWVSRHDFYQCFTDSWPEGRSDMVELAYYHYEVGKIFHGKTDLDECASPGHQFPPRR